jgi:hypothetical protein
MNEKDWADRFVRDVDNFLDEAGQTDIEPTPAEYSHTLDLARDLITTDFSAESQIRQTLRRRLLNRINAREGRSQRKEYTMSNFFKRRHPAVIIAAVVLVSLSVVAFVSPGTLTTLAQNAYNVIQRIVLGPNTEVVQIDPQDIPDEPPPLPPDMWSIHTDIGGFGGNVPPGTDTSVRSVTDFEEAQALTPFHLRAPHYLPPGYSLREIKLTPSNGGVFLFYGGAGHDIILIQTLVGPQPGDSPNESSTVKSGYTTTSGSLEEVDLNSHPAAWINDRALAWEADSISYTLGGLDLDLEEAIRMATSLE